MMSDFDRAWQRLQDDQALQQRGRQVLEQAADAGRVADVAAAAEQLRRDPAGTLALLSCLQDPRPAEQAARAAAHQALHDYLTAGR